MNCGRPDDVCHVRKTIAGINRQLADDQAKHGFKYRAEMDFGMKCKTCNIMRYWKREADGTIKEIIKAAAA